MPTTSGIRTSLDPSHVASFSMVVIHDVWCTAKNRSIPRSERAASSCATTSCVTSANSHAHAPAASTATLSQNPVGDAVSVRRASHPDGPGNVRRTHATGRIRPNRSDTSSPRSLTLRNSRVATRPEMIKITSAIPTRLASAATRSHAVPAR